MIRYVLRFCLCSPEGLSGQAEKVWYKKQEPVLTALGEKLTSWDWRADVTPPRTGAFLNWLRQVRREGARVNGPVIEEKLVADGTPPAEWFELDPKYEGDLQTLVWNSEDRVADYLTFLRLHADRMKPVNHVAGWGPFVYVSARFKAVVEASKLGGIEFIWCPDVGKHRAPQWYLPICSHSLGRGLDHPWFDTKALDDPGQRCGIEYVRAELCRRNARFSHPRLKELATLLRSMEVLKRRPEVDSFPRYLRKYVPDADFARTSEEFGLAMNCKARAILKRERVITDDDLIPTLILDRAPKGVPDLDRRYGPPAPPFSLEQLTAIRRQESDAWANQVSKIGRAHV